MKSKLNSILSFRHTHLRMFFVSALIPIIALFVVLSLYYTNLTLESNRTSVSDMLDTAVSMVGSHMSEQESISFTPYLYSDIEQTMIYMKNGYLKPAASPSPYLNTAYLENNYEMLFTKMLHTSRQKVQNIAFYPFGAGMGDCYTVSRSTAGLQYAQTDPETVTQMYEITASYGTDCLFLHMEGSSEDTYSLLRTIRDIDAQKDLGILRIDIKTDALAECMTHVAVTEHSCLLLLDSQGDLISQTGSAAPELIQAALDGETHGRDGLQFYQLLMREVRGWRLVYIGSVRDIAGSFGGSIAIIFAVILLAFASTFLLYRLQSKNIMAAIEAILDAIQQLQKGNLTYVCRVKDNEEYQVIGDALNEMGQNLQNLIQAEAEARASQSRAEFTALQSQINPHFLYNTLNGFIALNRMGERQQLETSIFQLTRLFRHICSRNETVTVEQEYQFASQYLELQKLRFEDKIQYRIEFGDGAAQQMVPKLVIQPLVENCIVHGMEESEDPIAILLRADLWEDQSLLVMEVTDTGVGFDTSTLETSPRVGLKNVLSRLELFCPGARYEIHSAPGKGTRVRLLIPLPPRAEQEESHAHPAG